jgi:uncharacterized membrane protein
MTAVAGLGEQPREVPPRIHERVGARSIERIAALADGVFAISMTLLVLEVRLPSGVALATEQEVIAALASLGPRLLAYATSFVTLGLFWQGLQNQVNAIQRGDRTLAWIVMLALMAVALMPFTTSLVGDLSESRVALVVYWVNLLALGIAGSVS